MTITRNFKLYLNAGTASAPYINVNQYDEGEEWVFTLYNEDGSTYTPSSGAIIGIKSDGNAIMNAGSVVGGKVVITETEQMTAASGRAIFELLIDNATHGTANFIVNVERRPSDDAEFSDSDLSMLQEAIDAAEVINEILDAGGDPSEIIAENVDAWLDNHPEATTTVQDGAITAPKINNSLWDKILVNEEVSGNPASFEDGADDVPVSSLKVALEPIQTGSGDPSPTNVRPIIASNGKNLLQNTATTQTVNGITFTVNADGTVTANGTATANATLLLVNNTQIVPTDTSVIVSGCPSGGGSSTYRVFVKSDADAGYVYDTGSGVTVNGVYRISITVYSGTTGNNLVFKPMIRLASITDSTYQPYQGIMVERNGKNLLPKGADRTSSNVAFTVNDDGTVTANGTASSTVFWGAQFTIPAGTYTYNGCPSGGGPSTYYCDIRTGVGGSGITGTGSDTGNGNTFTITEPLTAWLNIRVASGTVCNNLVFKPMIRYASVSDDTFEPYTSTSYPYTLGQSVYGGTVDMATGVLTVDKAIVDLGGLTWTYDSTQTCFFTVISDMKVFAYGDSATYLCDSYKTIAPTYSAGDGQNNTIWARVGQTSFRVRDTSYTVAADFKAAVSGHQLVYELATPTTVQLTPQEVKTLLGYNNISSSGTVDVIYHADTKLYIDKRIAELG